MASPNTTFVPGAIFTAQQASNYPFGYMKSAENLALAQTFTTIVDLTNMSVNFTGIASRRYRIDAYLLFQSTVANDGVNLQIKNVTTGLVIQQAIYPLPLSTSAYMATASVIIAATGSTTIKLSAVRQYGTGTITANGAATYPAQLVITDIGTL